MGCIVTKVISGLVAAGFSVAVPAALAHAYGPQALSISRKNWIKYCRNSCGGYIWYNWCNRRNCFTKPTKPTGDKPNPKSNPNPDKEPDKDPDNDNSNQQDNSNGGNQNTDPNGDAGSGVSGGSEGAGGASGILGGVIQPDKLIHILVWLGLILAIPGVILGNDGQDDVPPDQYHQCHRYQI